MNQALPVPGLLRLPVPNPRIELEVGGRLEFRRFGRPSYALGERGIFATIIEEWVAGRIVEAQADDPRQHDDVISTVDLLGYPAAECAERSDEVGNPRPFLEPVLRWLRRTPGPREITRDRRLRLAQDVDAEPARDRL